MIIKALNKLIWTIFIKGPLNIISSFNSVLNYLTGGVIGDLMFGAKSEFSFHNIPITFWYFVISALGLFMIIFIITMIKILFQDSTETKTKFILAIQNGSKSFFFIFIIPIFFFLGNFAISNITKMITAGFGGQNGNIANYLYNIGNVKWDGTANNVLNNYDYPTNINDYNMIAQIFGVWFMLFSLFMVGIALIQKTIELFFLFIISPWVMVAMTIDNGKGAFIWKDMVIAKFFASTATLTGYFIFMSVIQTILTVNLSGLGIEGIGKSVFIILFMCGGGLAVTTFSDIVSNLLGESAGIREGMNSMKSTVAGSMMALGAGKVVGKAFGFAKSKRAKKALANGINDDSLNAMSSSDYHNQEDYQQETDNGNSFTNKKPIDMRFYLNSKSGLSSRSGFAGLAGIALGATTLATSKLVGAARGGGIKGFWKTIGKGATLPFVKIGKIFNPRLKSVGDYENRRNTMGFIDEKNKSLKKKIKKIENNFIKKNNFSSLKPIRKNEVKYNKNVKINNDFYQQKQKSLKEKLENKLGKKEKLKEIWKTKDVKKLAKEKKKI